MRAAILLLTFSLLLAGCTGSDGDVEPASGDEALGVRPARAAPTPSPGEESEAAPEPASESGEEEGVAAPVRATEVISYQGNTGVGLCLPTGPRACAGPGPVVPPAPSETWHIVEPRTGRPVEVSLTLTWDAPTPTTEELRVMVMATRSCGDRCREGAASPAIDVQGTSPLEVGGALPPLGEGESYGILVWTQAAPTPSPVYANVHPDQPFQVEGTLTTESP